MWREMLILDQSELQQTMCALMDTLTALGNPNPTLLKTKIHHFGPTSCQTAGIKMLTCACNSPTRQTIGGWVKGRGGDASPFEAG